ncbi:MAG: flagellar biosynthesis anti-sigma factor FlgM [Pseudomonadota bacterium]|uniref:flagellar biosynthesis anti-sigma factor FlgM n=1 Tax=Sphingomonas sp. ERG5 TaxID=1381597 RepID=UPI00054B4CD1|nr:flagellar biosynthesis anti-sigma factor FlgM [Sphingomonas sp. ERG5]
MVDPLGVKPVQTSDRGVAPVARVVAPAVVQKSTGPETEAVSQSSLAIAAKEFSAKPPINSERIAEIRKAIADGHFPIYPAQIADRLIAAKFEWTRNDPA